MFIVIALIFTTAAQAQIELTLRGNKTILVSEFSERNGTLTYVDTSGDEKEISSRKVKRIKNLSLKENEFEYNQLGLTPYVVSEFKGVSQNKLYDLTTEWLAQLSDSKEVEVKTKMENDKIRFSGLALGAVMYDSFGYSNEAYDGRYVVEIYFKDGKYKLEPLELTSSRSNGIFGDSNRFVVNLKDTSKYYRPSGRIIGSYQNFPEGIERAFNELNENLQNYINNKLGIKTDQNDDW